ncbi:hypothetical protein JVT61DRAFT_4089 [Boletus reticuloceps]|uniref:Uncharacterized protein n=1 Tax=Boletus reticuloceps TaxID=495285 RepID=A0A8I2YLI2_9AGAM|nr:hypothetical protein JVT61DRAFT_4089 [Boletus reticuloceps]
MPRRRNYPWVLPCDTEYKQEYGSKSPPPEDTASDAGSYDEYGQPRFGGVGQGAPLDENGRYIYSQVGMPIFPSPPPPAPSIDLLTEESLDHNGQADTAVAHDSEHATSHPSLKRKFDDVFDDSLPQTPRRLGGSLTNTPTHVRCLPATLPPATKQRRLRAPFGLGLGLQASRMERLEDVVNEMRQDLIAGLAKQTEILAGILAVLGERNPVN